MAGYLPLSEFSHIGSIAHLQTISFYRAPPQNDTVPNTLRKSLSQALVTFFLLAGRLRWVGSGENHLELDCNGMGAQFIEVEFGSKLDDFGSLLLYSPEYYVHLFPNVDYTLQLDDIPNSLGSLVEDSAWNSVFPML